MTQEARAEGEATPSLFYKWKRGLSVLLESRYPGAWLLHSPQGKTPHSKRRKAAYYLNEKLCHGLGLL